jgi:hypothetical protein
MDIEDFGRLSEASAFYLYESFRYANALMEHLLAGELFGELLQKVDPTDEDRAIIANANIPGDPIELMRDSGSNLLSSGTFANMALAWGVAQKIATGNSFSFDTKTKCTGVDMLGLVNNLTFTLEVLTYRHLLFLLQTKAIDKYTYEKFEQANPVVTLLFVFKDHVTAGTIKTDKIQFLYKLRNKAVHYTPTNAKGLAVQLSELFLIWKQMISVFKLFEQIERFEETPYSEILTGNMNDFTARWIKGKLTKSEHTAQNPTS